MKNQKMLWKILGCPGIWKSVFCYHARHFLKKKKYAWSNQNERYKHFGSVTIIFGHSDHYFEGTFKRKHSLKIQLNTADSLDHSRWPLLMETPRIQYNSWKNDKLLEKSWMCVLPNSNNLVNSCMLAHSWHVKAKEDLKKASFSDEKNRQHLR